MLLPLTLLLTSPAFADEYSAESRERWMTSCRFSMPEQNCACILDGFEADIPEPLFRQGRMSTDEIGRISLACVALHPITPEAAAAVEAHRDAVIAQEVAAAPPQAAPVAAAAPMQQSTPRTPRAVLPWVPVNVALAGPAEVFHEPEVVGPLSLSVLHGRDTSVVGLQLGGLYQQVDERLIGFQVAPLNATHGDVFGAQLGAVNGNRGERGEVGSVYGLQAGLHSFGGGCHGLCISGLWSTYDSGSGIHISPFYTTTLAGFRGIQISAGNIIGMRIDSIEEISRTPVGGGMERVETRVEGATRDDALGQGLQIGAIGNYTRSYRGVQLAGFGNVAERDLGGVQLGFVNYARDVTGLQIGVLNMARKLHGVQIGALNVATKNKLPFMVLINAGF